MYLAIATLLANIVCTHQAPTDKPWLQLNSFAIADMEDVLADNLGKHLGKIDKPHLYSRNWNSGVFKPKNILLTMLPPKVQLENFAEFDDDVNRNIRIKLILWDKLKSCRGCGSCKECGYTKNAGAKRDADEVIADLQALAYLIVHQIHERKPEWFNGNRNWYSSQYLDFWPLPEFSGHSNRVAVGVELPLKIPLCFVPSEWGSFDNETKTLPEVSDCGC
ncbi:MAG: hypothetical protein ACPG5B_02200 [Chitinophagales bacterium]